MAGGPGLERLRAQVKCGPAVQGGAEPGRGENARRLPELPPFSPRDSCAASGWLTERPLTGPAPWTGAHRPGGVDTGEEGCALRLAWDWVGQFPLDGCEGMGDGETGAPAPPDCESRRPVITRLPGDGTGVQPPVGPGAQAWAPPSLEDWDECAPQV